MKRICVFCGSKRGKRPEYAEAHYMLGTIFKQRGDVDAALAEFRDTIRINPASAEAHTSLAQTLQATHDAAGAAAALAEAERLNKVKAVLLMWWPGDEGGWATADLLLGKASPAGRLPFTWGKRLEDYAATDPEHPERYPPARGLLEGLTRRDLEEIIGTRTRIAEVLNRKRGLSIAMIRRLHDRLGISAEVLIRPSRKNAA